MLRVQKRKFCTQIRPHPSCGGNSLGTTIGVMHSQSGRPIFPERMKFSLRFVRSSSTIFLRWRSSASETHPASRCYHTSSPSYAPTSPSYHQKSPVPLIVVEDSDDDRKLSNLNSTLANFLVNGGGVSRSIEEIDHRNN